MRLDDKLERDEPLYAEREGDFPLSEMKDSNDNVRKLERLYYRLGLELYDEIHRGGGKRLEIDNSIALLVKKIAALRKGLGYFELERRIDRRFEKMENQLEQLADLICQRIPSKSEVPMEERPGEPEKTEDLFKRKPMSFSEYHPQKSESPRVAASDSGAETEEKARAKARSLAQAEANARMKAREQDSTEKGEEIQEFPAESKPVKKASPVAVDKIRRSIKDLQTLVKSRENRIQETRQEITGIPTQASKRPSTEVAKSPAAVEKIAGPGKEKAEKKLSETEKLSTAQVSSSDWQMAEEMDLDFSSRRIDENQLFMKLAPQIPDSADRLSYLEFLRDLQSGSPTSRIVAAEGLIKWRIPLTETSLISAWKKEKEFRVRTQIIESLKTIRSGQITGVFREFLNSRDTRAQLMALEGLNRWGSQEGMRYIIEGLRSGHPMVRRRAVTYIGWNMHRKALPELVRLLRDPSLYVRKTTVAVVISFGENSSVFFLLDILNDEDESIRANAFKNLVNMTGQDFGYHPAARQNQRLEAIVAWKKWWRKNEHSFKILSPGSTHIKKPEPPESKPVVPVRPEQPEKELESAEEPKQSVRTAKKLPVSPPLPDGSLEQRMYDILLQKQAKGMTIQDIGSFLNLPWQKLIQKTGLLQKTGWVYKDHHLFFPILKQ